MKKRTYRIGKFFRVLALLLSLTLVLGSTAAFAANDSLARLLKNVEPKGETQVTAGERVTLRALAAKEASVSVNLAGTGLPLIRAEREDSSYYWFEASYVIPTNAAAGQHIGDITFTAKLDGRSETRTVPGFTVMEIGGSSNTPAPPTPSTPSTPGTDLSGVKPVAGQQVIITPQSGYDYADVFIPSERDRGEDYSAPYYYQLPRGTIDYVSSAPSDSANCQLASGRRVKYTDIQTYAMSGTLGNNAVTGVSLSADRSYTTVKISGSWSVPFNVEALPFTYRDSSNNVAAFNPTKVVVSFDYTTSIQTGSITFPENSCFTSASVYTRMQNGIAQGVLELTLREPGKYYGCYAAYPSMGNLELRFLNPVNSLQGVRIAIDSGHGSYKNAETIDRGAISGNVYEDQLNWDKARALADELRSRGAEVYLLDTWRTSSLYSLYARVNAAVQWEPHIYVAVHHNSASNTTARGPEVYYNTPWSVNLAKNVYQSLCGAYRQMDPSGAKERHYRFSEYAVTRGKQFASILVETGYITNPQEQALLTNPNNLPIFARAIADGIEDYLAGN